MWGQGFALFGHRERGGGTEEKEKVEKTSRNAGADKTLHLGGAFAPGGILDRHVVHPHVPPIVPPSVLPLTSSLDAAPLL